MCLNSQPGKVQHFYYPPEKTIFPVGLGEFFNDSEIAGAQNTACVTRKTRRARGYCFFFSRKKKKKREPAGILAKAGFQIIYCTLDVS